MNALESPPKLPSDKRPLIALGLFFFLLAGGLDWVSDLLGRAGASFVGRPREPRYHTYTAETLRARLEAFEHRYGMSSEEWARRHAAGERLPEGGAEPGLAGFDETVWASIWDEYLRLRERERSRLHDAAAAAQGAALSGFERHFERRRGLFARYVGEALADEAFAIGDGSAHVEIRLPLAVDAFAALFELLELDAKGRPLIVAYSYWLIVAGERELGFDLHPRHEPASHMHERGGPARPCAPISLSEALGRFRERLASRGETEA